VTVAIDFTVAHRAPLQKMRNGKGCGGRRKPKPAGGAKIVNYWDPFMTLMALADRMSLF
jgi:hypothetical protein